MANRTDLSELVSRNKNSLFALVIILFSLIIAYRIYEWQTAQLNSLNSKISEEKKKNIVLADIGNLESEFNVYKTLLAKHDSSMVMSDVNNIARDTGIKIISIRPLGESASDDYTKYKFVISIESPDYNSFAKFINRLETFERVYLVEDSNIESLSYNKDKELRANLRISTVAILN